MVCVIRLMLAPEGYTLTMIRVIRFMLAPEGYTLTMVHVIRFMLAPGRKCTYNGLCNQVYVGTWEEMHLQWSVLSGLCWHLGGNALTMVCVIRFMLARGRKCTYNGLCYQVHVGTWEEMHLQWSVLSGLCWHVGGNALTMVRVIRFMLAPGRKCTYNGLFYEVDIGTWEEMHLQWSVLLG